MIEQIGLFLAGLGLFIAGLRILSSSLQEISSGRIRHLFKWINNRVIGVFWGLVAGAISQSAAGITVIVSIMVSNNVLNLTTGLSMVGWLGVGTTLLVFLVSFNIKFAVLYLMGITGILYGFQKSSRRKLYMSALLGVAMLLYGFQIIGSSGKNFSDLTVFQYLFEYQNLGLIIAFVIGAVLRVVLQSQAGVVLLAITIGLAGEISFYQIMMIVYGSYLASGPIMYMFSKGVSGRAREICIYKSLTYIFTSVVMVFVLVFERYFDLAGVKYVIEMFIVSLELKVAMVYMLSCIVEGLISEVFMSPIYKFAQRLTPFDHTEGLSTSKYITSFIDDVEASLDLVDLEKQRIIRRFPKIIDNIRKETSESEIVDNEILYNANRALIKNIKQYLSETYKSKMNKTTADRLMKLQTNLDLIYGLNNVLNEFVTALKSACNVDEIIESEDVLIESLHLLCLTMNDAARSQSQEDLILLSTLTSDKGDVMHKIRENFIKYNEANEKVDKQRFLHLTNLYQRSVWLFNRWAHLNQS